MTIKDIAKLSGVGVATVSRVLNHHPDVSEDTRRKVLAVVEEQGFQPNTNAKHLKQQTSASVAVIVKGTMNMLFADLVERCQQLLQDAGRDAAVYYLARMLYAGEDIKFIARENHDPCRRGRGNG